LTTSVTVVEIHLGQKTLIERMVSRPSAKERIRLFVFGILAGTLTVAFYCACLGVDRKYDFPASTFFLCIFGPAFLCCTHYSAHLDYVHSCLARIFGRGFIISSLVIGGVIALKVPDAHMAPFLHWIMHPIRSIAFGTIVFAVLAWIDRRDLELKNEV
jgi:hypothetical protein